MFVILFENGTGVVIMEKSLTVFCVGVIQKVCPYSSSVGQKKCNPAVSIGKACVWQFKF